MIAYLIVIGLVVVLAIQDMQHRQVSVWLLAVLGAATLWAAYSNHLIWIDMLLNAGYLLFLFALTGLYLLVTRRKPAQMIGKGDIVFLIVLLPLFSFEAFSYWLILSLLVSLIIHGLVQWLIRPKEPSIPLVTYLSLCLMFHLIPTLFESI
ncbi:prepilin peptidase [Reichenbachiella ulvae]|uniref:Type IV leader peptidase family protein n=1 Tax=Reichenbachiella ulvae TaxID=2980104 RepID=A0ABT3CUT3_9BACT|nr:prepilin peptidase [Reichenbachiella ulvae]MCV9387456.1 hypothetical protein [Reichenbachiella ulvae]